MPSTPTVLCCSQTASSARRPAHPAIVSATLSASYSMVTTRSAPSTASPGVAATVATSARRSALSAVRFQTRSGRPAAAMLRAMPAPMVPVPSRATVGWSVIGILSWRFRAPRTYVAPPPALGGPPEAASSAVVRRRGLCVLVGERSPAAEGAADLRRVQHPVRRRRARGPPAQGLDRDVAAAGDDEEVAGAPTPQRRGLGAHQEPGQRQR